MSSAKLAEALARMGESERVRRVAIALLRRYERIARHPGSVRDDITGPLVEALHAHVDVARKSLRSGLVFDFRPRGRITREFLLSTPAVPDHVWEPQTTRLLLHLARSARHVLIGGAYFGDHALPIAQQIAAGGGVVHAFEPNARNVALLAHNAELNKLANVRAHRKGLWERTARLKLADQDEDALAGSAELAPGDANDADAFDAVSMDDYAATLDGPVGLVMLDIEGGKLSALRGARGLLSRPGPTAPHLVFEVHSEYVDWSRGLHRTEIVEYVASMGYEVYAVRDAHANVDLHGHPIELIPAARTYLEGPPHGFNMLGVKDAALVRTDLFRIRPDVSPKYLFHKDPALFHPLAP